MRFLGLDDIEIIHMQVIDATGGSQGVRDRGRIEAAVNSLEQEVFVKVLYPTIFDKAATLMRAIIANHAFIDGNKRTGIMVALVLLNINGYDTSILPDKELEDFAVRVAVEHLDVPEIAEWLKGIVGTCR